MALRVRPAQRSRRGFLVPLAACLFLSAVYLATSSARRAPSYLQLMYRGWDGESHVHASRPWARQDAVHTPLSWSAPDAGNDMVQFPGAGGMLDPGAGNETAAPVPQSLPVRAPTADHRLSRALIDSVAQNNTVVVTWANFHYRDFVWNWVYHLNQTGCTAFVVGAADEPLLDWLVERGIPAFVMASGLSLDDLVWGSKQFQKLGFGKKRLLEVLTGMGYSVIVTDVDMVWLRNPMDFVARYPDADILVSSDEVNTSTSNGEEMEHLPGAAYTLNIGIMLLRPGAKDFAKEWMTMVVAEGGLGDQDAFGVLARRSYELLPERSDNLFKGYDGKLTMGVLSVALFCSGHTYFVQRMPELLGLEPYAVHTTFQYSGTPGKRNRMRERHLWVDDDAYFRHPAGFLSYAADVPKELLVAVENAPLGPTLNHTLPHFNLVNHQLSQIRSQLILAQQLGGRAVVLPDLWCGMDRGFREHTGKFRDSALTLPFHCPADYVLDLAEWEHQMPKTWREYSFLDRPQAQHLSRSKLTLVICQEGDSDARCHDGSKAADLENDAVRILPRRTPAQLATALQSAVKGYQLVHVEGRMADLVKLEGEDLERAQRDFQTLTDIHCCVFAHPGHIWYDLFWDVGPHITRHGVPALVPWRPTTGPWS